MSRRQSSVTVSGLLNESHSKQQVNRIILAVEGNQRQFDVLMKIFLGKNEELARRAAWAMSYIVINHPQLIKKWYPEVIEKLAQSNQHPAVYRNTFRFLEVIDIPEKYAAEILDAAYSFILNRAQPVAIRAFAISTAMNVVRSQPGLANELRAVVREVMTEKSPAVQSRGKRVLAELTKLR